VDITPHGKTAFVNNLTGGTVSTIDVKTKTKDPVDIPVGGSTAGGLAITPDSKTAFVANLDGDTLSTIDVKARLKNSTEIPVGANPVDVALTLDGKTAVVTHGTPLVMPVPGSVSTVDVKTSTKDPTDIPVGLGALGVTVTPCRR
jgi:YVTN family beta-propeller protein